MVTCRLTDSSLQLGLACSVVSFPVLFLFSERKQFRRRLHFGRIDVWLVFALHWHCAHLILFSKRYGFYGSNFFTKYTNIKKEKMRNWLAINLWASLVCLVSFSCSVGTSWFAAACGSGPCAVPAKDTNTLKLGFLVPRTGQPFKLLGRLLLAFCLRRSAMRSLPWLTQVASVVGKKSSGGYRWFVVIVCEAWVRVSPTLLSHAADLACASWDEKFDWHNQTPSS